MDRVFAFSSVHQCMYNFLLFVLFCVVRGLVRWVLTTVCKSHFEHLILNWKV